MAGDYDPAENGRTHARFDRQIIWAVLSLIYAAMAGVIIGFVYDSATASNAASTGNQSGIWLALAAIVVFGLLNLPALIISLRTLRLAAQSSIPLAVSLISIFALLINIWVIIRDIVVVVYVLFVNGVQSGGVLVIYAVQCTDR
jgi:hypothetical protein